MPPNLLSTYLGSLQKENRFWTKKYPSILFRFFFATIFTVWALYCTLIQTAFQEDAFCYLKAWVFFKKAKKALCFQAIHYHRASQPFLIGGTLSCLYEIFAAPYLQSTYNQNRHQVQKLRGTPRAFIKASKGAMAPRLKTTPLPVSKKTSL